MGDILDKIVHLAVNVNLYVGPKISHTFLLLTCYIVLCISWT